LDHIPEQQHQADNSITFNLPEFPYAYGGPPATGNLRSVLEDFIVHEKLGYDLSGSGEHACLCIEKKSENTDYVAGQLARFAAVAKRDVSYAGLKDRYAVTRQWFSVWLPGKADPDWEKFQTDGIKIIKVLRHSRKIKRGALSGNDFTVVIRDLQGDLDSMERVLVEIELHGVPNYFGVQRFGHQGRNIMKAVALFQGARMKKHQRGIYLSAARSLLFNQILARRVEAHNWHRAIPGDAMAFTGSKQYFKTALPDADIRQRISTGEISPTGALWGVGAADVSAEALSIEEDVAANYPELVLGLEQFGVEMARRSLRLQVAGLQWQFLDNSTLQLNFTLTSGGYATSVVRELIKT
jgi:tRNA pseudouridine13 synthase